MAGNSGGARHGDETKHAAGTGTHLAHRTLAASSDGGEKFEGGNAEVERHGLLKQGRAQRNSRFDDRDGHGICKVAHGFERRQGLGVRRGGGRSGWRRRDPRDEGGARARSVHCSRRDEQQVRQGLRRGGGDSEAFL